MTEKHDKLDFWYAAKNTRIVTMPARHLETFGATLLNYYIISELMDNINQVRVREGRIQAYRPQIIVPGSDEFNKVLDGFGEEAEKYMDWIKDHSADMHFLRYGFKIKKEEFSEQVLSDNLEAVTDKVKDSVKGKNDPFSAVVVGVDNPWEVSLLSLMVEVIRNSIPANVNDMKRRNLFGETDGVPNSIREELEKAFTAAGRNPKLIGTLAKKLEKYGVFEKYQDRFFSLVRPGSA